MKARHLILGALTLLGLGQPLRARAAGPLAANGEPIRTSEYAVDLSQGLILDGSRPTGLAGAYVAIGEGVDGIRQNPASPAVRMPYSFDDFDYDLGVGFTFPAMVKDADYFNSGQRTTDVGVHSKGLGFVFLNASGIVQWGAWGFGAAFDLQDYVLQRSRDQETGIEQDELYARFLTWHLQLARAVGDIIIGGGTRITGLQVTRKASLADPEAVMFETTGAALQGGLLWRPVGLPLRFGASFRSEVANDTTTARDGVVEVTAEEDRVIRDPNDPTNLDAPNTIYLPNEVLLPWDVNVGWAVQFGPRPFNPKWVNPGVVLVNLRRYLAWRKLERERRREALLLEVERQGGDVNAARAAIDAQLETEAALDQKHLEREERRVDRELRRRYAQLARFYVLLSASVLITGPVRNAVGVESFLQRRVNRSGEQVSLSPRLGVESEVIPHWLRLRGGSYLEPTRFQTSSAAARLHGTFGLDVRLFPWTVFGLFEEGTSWRAGGVVDGSQRYLGWGATIGVWH